VGLGFLHYIYAGIWILYLYFHGNGFCTVYIFCLYICVIFLTSEYYSCLPDDVGEFICGYAIVFKLDMGRVFGSGFWK